MHMSHNLLLMEQLVVKNLQYAIYFFVLTI